MSQKQSQDLIVTGAMDTTVANPIVGGPGVDRGPALPGSAGVTVTQGMGVLKKTTADFSDIFVPVPNIDKYANIRVITFPGGTPGVVVGAKIDVVAVKDGTGILATTDLEFGLGNTAANSSDPLGINAVNYSGGFTQASNLLTVNLGRQWGSLMTSLVPAGAMHAFFNVAANTILADGSLTLSGKIEVFWWDFGSWPGAFPPP